MMILILFNTALCNDSLLLSDGQVVLMSKLALTTSTGSAESRVTSGRCDSRLSTSMPLKEEGRGPASPFLFYCEYNPPPPPAESSISTPSSRHSMTLTPFEAMYRCQHVSDVLMSTLSSLTYINVDHWRLNLVVSRG
jgi:hypothetical protein